MSNEYKDWMRDRVIDLETALNIAIKALKSLQENETATEALNKIKTYYEEVCDDTCHNN